MANSVKNITKNITDPELLGAVEHVLNTVHGKNKENPKKPKKERKNKYPKYSQN